MKLLDYTTQSGFLPHIKCDSVQAAVVDLVGGIAAANDVDDCDGLVADVMHREVEGSTAIGGGLVIPHARSTHVRQLRIAVATLAHPLDIPAEDGRPVDIVILLVGPTGDPRLMLRLLARLARLVKQGEYLDGLRAAASATDLQQAFASVGDASA